MTIYSMRLIAKTLLVWSKVKSHGCPDRLEKPAGPGCSIRPSGKGVREFEQELAPVACFAGALEKGTGRPVDPAAPNDPSFGCVAYSLRPGCVYDGVLDHRLRSS